MIAGSITADTTLHETSYAVVKPDLTFSKTDLAFPMLTVLFV
jgi:hypothetical protein